MSSATAYLLRGTDSQITPLPPIPTRAQVCGLSLTFQGLDVLTQQWGVLPWFDAYLQCLTPADRQSVYATKRATGRDSHCILSFANHGYTEPGQPYAAIPWVDLTADIPRFRALIREIVSEGFHVAIFLDGDGDNPGYQIAVAQLYQVVAALKTSERDFNADCLISPGWDGVWYGWTYEHVRDWGRLARSLSPNGYFAFEYTPGHLPLGNGSVDFAINGPMSTYDTLLGEFNVWPHNGSPGDQSWQVAARVLGPSYRRPPDQPSWDDPRPPWYLATGTPRGPYVPVMFERGEYEWVRRWITSSDIARMRAYDQALGWSYVC